MLWDNQIRNYLLSCLWVNGKYTLDTALNNLQLIFLLYNFLILLAIEGRAVFCFPKINNRHRFFKINIIVLLVYNVIEKILVPV